MTRLALVLALACACDPEPPPEPPRVAVEEGRALGVPPGMIDRARREATGLARLTPRLRDEALARHREGAPSYAEVSGDPREGDPASFEGQLALIRPAGDRLWILALKTRRDGARWTDPIYVLSVIEPELAEGATARADGWVVGPRRIGRHTLPLVLAYSVR